MKTDAHSHKDESAVHAAQDDAPLNAASAFDCHSHGARITGPVAYASAAGQKLHIPLGPCLVEQLDPHSVAIVWGPQGQNSADLPVAEVQAAQETGSLVLLD